MNSFAPPSRLISGQALGSLSAYRNQAGNQGPFPIKIGIRCSNRPKLHFKSNFFNYHSNV
jgi:hypothetical protein